MRNAIILKKPLTFQEYQLAVKALEQLGIEIQEPETTLTEDEIRHIKEGLHDLENNQTISSEEMFSKINNKVMKNLQIT